ncbi:6-phosphofructokinase [Rhizopus microsporus var. microsporus]|uniref:ATP-dependent 6-phosphofructokinase n=2 Tax=Rhizopus microsporus TaxID=58291 RepID=A0A2G4T4I9_RHIZD|nr:6-phosphofructokinase [Rhizopus microsporus ATCC 52813]ORE10195.1 6-phosphofructokinase [Rhizopus microsporus var. microsporus]PHZ15931.1 6-phosphofructokinase [Rhizopus microsporus ATCC 52813]
MLSQGLSFIIFNASNQQEVQETISFYEAIGFHVVSDKAYKERTVWLRSKSNTTIQLVLNSKAKKQAKPSTDSDWSLEEIALAFYTENLQEIKSKLTNTPVQDHSKDGDLKLYAIDPLNNVIVFTNKAIEITNNAVEAINTAITANSQKKRQKIAVLTSGGDAPGMNAVVRAVVRYGITKGCDIFAVYEGYQGLVDGGDLLKKMDWKSVRGWLAVGGTTIGTARCMSFKTREGRLQAAENLIKNGIDSLIVCGGDGSLTGADLFRSEWSGLVKELKETGRINVEQAETYKHLTIVGLVGSIDNDMSSTDITIGAVTSLHRICEAVDSVSTTALSHSRAFVIEVMGRHCGWLALMAGIATGADFVFIPEKPPQEDDWESTMCSVIERHRKLGKRKTVVIVAEGAIDKNLNAIKADHLKDILTNRLGLDTRVTILGHTQRGGSPAFFDRLLATVQSIEAVNAVLEATPDAPSPMIGMSNNKVTRYPLMEAVKLTHEVAEAISRKDFAHAMALRDPQFAEEYEAYNATTILDDNSMGLPKHRQMRIAVVHVGAPAGGMNAATRTAVRYCLNRGHTPIAVSNGFAGLARGSMKEMSWMSVDGWTDLGGSELGTNRAVPGKDIDMGMITYQLQQHQIQGLLVIGGFEAYAALDQLQKARQQYPSLRIPITLIPATISNNVPGTDYSLGSDTSLNSIVDSCDAIVQSAQSSRRRVFVVEVMGGRSGYLAVEAGLAVGANTVYIPEEGISLSRLQSDVNHLKAMYADDDPDRSEGRIILRTEDVSKTYTTEVISNILKDEGEDMFDSRTAILGHIQQGTSPSPLDRIRATRITVRAIQFIETHASEALDQAQQAGNAAPVELTNTNQSVTVAGIHGNSIVFRPVADLMKETDMKNRKPYNAWWAEHRPIIDLLAGRGLFSTSQ